MCPARLNILAHTRAQKKKNNHNRMTDTEWYPVDFGDDIAVHKRLQEHNRTRKTGLAQVLSSKLTPFGNNNNKTLRELLASHVPVQSIIVEHRVRLGNLFAERITIGEFFSYGYNLDDLGTLGCKSHTAELYGDLDDALLMRNLVENYGLDKHTLGEYCRAQLSPRALNQFLRGSEAEHYVLSYTRHLRAYLHLEIWELGPRGIYPCDKKHLRRMGVSMRLIVELYPGAPGQWLNILGHLQLPLESCALPWFGLLASHYRAMRLHEDAARVASLGWDPARATVIFAQPQ